MNRIKQINFEYLTPNKTIEELLVFNDHSEGIFYLYNYKGTSFRLFPSKQKLDDFFDNSSDETLHFQTEETLDNYLNHIQLP
ncbi:hypothetical protein [Gracilimonas halophila]|uniref:KTSC domain-containing protein n=1 Tax=Gracilimonas halophila TaxID=1834464 RepID=A0ABW5JIH4_9BACT